MDYYLNGFVTYKDPKNECIPGNGLLGVRAPNIEFSHNAVDIESYLRGTGTVNLVKPMETPTPQLKSMPSLNIIDKLPVYLPEPLNIEQNQRPYW